MFCSLDTTIVFYHNYYSLDRFNGGYMLRYTPDLVPLFALLLRFNGSNNGSHQISQLILSALKLASKSAMSRWCAISLLCNRNLYNSCIDYCGKSHVKVFSLFIANNSLDQKWSHYLQLGYTVIYYWIFYCSFSKCWYGLDDPRPGAGGSGAPKLKNHQPCR